MANNQHSGGGLSHEKIETSNFLMIVLILIVLLFGGLVEIVPLFFQKSTTQPVEGLKPYTALQVAGRDVYVREGCYNCHSQMIRPFRAETLRYGPYSVAGEFVYDRPFQWGSKRTGPDVTRVARIQHACLPLARKDRGRPHQHCGAHVGFAHPGRALHR
jgi:cytochrome c oxidase cbb3-type subunit 2